MSIGIKMPQNAAQFSWMGNNAHGYGGSGSMFDIAGNNAGFDIGNFTENAVGGFKDFMANKFGGNKNTEQKANETLEKSAEETGGDPTPGEAIGQGFKDAGNIMANMYRGSSGPIFS